MPRPSQRYFANAQLDPRLRAGLVGHWIGGGSGNTWFDRSGYGHHGTLTNGPIWTLGAGGNRDALSFDGTNDFVDAVDMPILYASTELSVSAWIWLSSTAINQTIVAKWDYQTQGTFGLQTGEADGSKIRLYVATAPTDAGTGCRFLTDSAVFVANQWQHVAFTYNGSASTVKIYVDGTERAATLDFGSLPATLTSATATVKIGKFGGSLTRYFQGRIDDVRIYKRTLSGAEVSLLADPAFQPVIPNRWSNLIGPAIPAVGGTGKLTLLGVG